MDRTDHCSCLKPPGCFGLSGLHFAPFDAAYVERRVLALQPGETDAQCLTYLEHGKDQGRREVVRHLLQSRAAHRQALSVYIGSEFAYERCEAWNRAYAEAMAAEKAKRSVEQVETATGTRLRR